MPYNGLPLLPPTQDVETKRVLKAAIEANKALAELRGMGGLLPNQQLLLRTMLLQEARRSSEIENIVTTNDALYRALDADSEAADPATREVLHYERALWHGFSRLREGSALGMSLFTDIVQIVKKTGIGVRQLPGTHIVNSQTNEPLYTPPEGEARIRDLLHNLSEYLYAEDGTDPLVKLAVVHYQFEAIHPFSDGNGRTGRIVNILYLIERGLLEQPVLYLSRFIVRNKAAYYERLRGVTERAEWEEWILYMLQAVEVTARETRAMLINIRDAIDGTLEFARSRMTRGYSRELIELVFCQPYTRIRTLVEAGISKRQTATKYLRDLERIGLLRSVKWGRDVLFLNQRLMELLEA